MTEQIHSAGSDPRVPAVDETANLFTRQVVGNKEDVASTGAVGTDKSLVAMVKQIITTGPAAAASLPVLVSGTFTTDSATVPADTGRTEADDYWKGCWLLPRAGSIDLQPRLIVGFANTGGVFTLDSEQPFSTTPGLVAYDVLFPTAQLTPAADSTANQTPAHVVGNKTDAAADGAVSAVESLMAYIKQAVTDVILVLADTGELQTDWTNGGRLDLIVDAILADTGTDGVVLGTKVAAYKLLVGENQMAATTIDLEQAAASYDLFTGTDQLVFLTALSFKLPNVDVSDDATITSISIQTDDVTPGVIFNTTEGAKANLIAEGELAWTGFMRITVGTKIQLTIAGGAADAATVCNVVAKYEAAVDGGNLA